jgi:hypothetical protein
VQPTPSINQSIARVRRAEEHLAELGKIIAEFVPNQENTLSIDFDPEPPHELKITDHGGVSIHILAGILIGEVCYNLRSAVDFLAYNLAWLDSGKRQDGTQFPIETKEKGFAGRKDTWLKGVNASHIAEIEALQPYKGCKWTEILRNVSNWDKHREFTLIHSEIRATGYLNTNPKFATANGRVRRATHPFHGEMDVKLDFTCSVEFPDGMPVAETLEVVTLGVIDALEFFKRDFPA